jgi:GNAT superfamily N-acetyltransferase
MIELHPSEFARLTPVLMGIKQKVLPQAICQGYCPGRIFVDRREHPQLILIWSGLGYYFIAGDPALSHNLVAASQVLREVFVPASQAGGENSFILVPAQDGWKDHLPNLLAGREVIEIYRRPFQFALAKFQAQPAWQDRIPAGCRLQIMDAALTEKLGAPPGWLSPEAFLTHGLGVALFAGNEIASLCTSVFASTERMEIDIHTDEKYQRKGFAALVASAFIEECLLRGKQPNWECFWENQASTTLAEKLGFHVEADYPVYYWEEGTNGLNHTPVPG